MSFHLENERGESLKIAIWSWGVIHDLVTEARIIPGQVWAPKRYNAGGALDSGQVASLAGFLADDLLPRLRRGEKLVCEGSAPDDGSDYDLPWKDHNLQIDELEGIVAFLRAAGGPVECL
jgi:hypothetical protein